MAEKRYDGEYVLAAVEVSGKFRNFWISYRNISLSIYDTVMTAKPEAFSCVGCEGWRKLACLATFSSFGEGAEVPAMLGIEHNGVIDPVERQRVARKLFTIGCVHPNVVQFGEPQGF